MKIIPKVVRFLPMAWLSGKNPTSPTYTLLLATLLLHGCLGGTSSSSTSSAITGFVPYRYSTSSFPLQFEVSNTFSADEINEFGNIEDAWEGAIDNNYNLLSFSSGNVAENTNYSSWGSFKVYNFVSSWPSGLSSLALAVTINYGINYGSYVQLTRGSVALNNKTYDFYTSNEDPASYDAGEYDLAYVMLHEFGHVLGIGHTSISTSIMNPYVSSGVDMSSIAGYSSYGKEVDDYALAYLKGSYGWSMDSYLDGLYSDIASESSSNLSPGLTPEALEEAGIEIGQTFMIAHELNPDGSCVHKINGHVVDVHHVDIHKLKHEAHSH